MNIDSAECLHVGRMLAEYGWSAAKHTHPFTELVVVLQGKLAVQLGAGEVWAAAGEVLAYPPQFPHRERVAAPRETDFIFIAASGIEHAEIAAHLHDSSGRVATLARWIYEEQSSSYERRGQSMHALLRALLAEMARLSRFKPSGVLEEMRAYLRDHLAEAHTVEALAARAGMSKFHFIREYKRLTGHTPMEDLRLLRVEAACDLLLTGDLPLKAVARRVGFCDEYYFSRVFRHYRQVSPGSFRKNRW